MQIFIGTLVNSMMTDIVTIDMKKIELNVLQRNPVFSYYSIFFLCTARRGPSCVNSVILPIHNQVHNSDRLFIIPTHPSRVVNSWHHRATAMFLTMHCSSLIKNCRFIYDLTVLFHQPIWGFGNKIQVMDKSLLFLNSRKNSYSYLTTYHSISMNVIT